MCVILAFVGCLFVVKPGFENAHLIPALIGVCQSYQKLFFYGLPTADIFYLFSHNMHDIHAQIVLNCIPSHEKYKAKHQFQNNFCCHRHSGKRIDFLIP